MEQLLINRKDAAHALGISLRLLDYKIAHGEVAVRRVGRRVLIAREELEKFANAREPARKPGPDGAES